MDLNKLILTGANYKVVLAIKGGGTYNILTGETISQNDSSEEESIYAIGEEDPIGNKTNGNKYGGKFSLQNGELNSILQLEGFKSPLQIKGAQIAITAVVGAFVKVYSGVNITNFSLDVKAKDKQSIANLDFSATEIK